MQLIDLAAQARAPRPERVRRDLRFTTRIRLAFCDFPQVREKGFVPDAPRIHFFDFPLRRAGEVFAYIQMIAPYFPARFLSVQLLQHPDYSADRHIRAFTLLAGDVGRQEALRQVPIYTVLRHAALPYPILIPGRLRKPRFWPSDLHRRPRPKPVFSRYEVSAQSPAGSKAGGRELHRPILVPHPFQAGMRCPKQLIERDRSFKVFSHTPFSSQPGGGFLLLRAGAPLSRRILLRFIRARLCCTAHGSFSPRFPGAGRQAPCVSALRSAAFRSLLDYSLSHGRRRPRWCCSRCCCSGTPRARSCARCSRSRG